MWILGILILLMLGCGNLDNSDLTGTSTSVNLVLKNPDESARGTAKAVDGPGAGFSVVKGDLPSVTSCVATCDNQSKTISFAAGSSEVIFTMDCSNNSTICVTCPDSSKTSNNVEFGFTGCTTLSGGTTATIDGKFLNQPTCSGALRSARVAEDNNTHITVEFLFDSALTDDQKTTTKGHFEICAVNNCSSCLTVDASSDGLLDTKGNPYISCEGGVITPRCFKYDTSGNKELKGSGSWGTTTDGNTKCTCKFGKTQWTQFDDREFNFCVSGTKDGSTYSKCPSSGVAVGKTSAAPNSDVGSLAAKGGSCSSANGCASGHCAYKSGSLICGCSGVCSLGGTATHLAGPDGSGTGSGSANGAETTATFDSPAGNCLSPDGKILYVADSKNKIIRSIDFSLATTSSSYVAKLAGIVGSTGFVNGSCNNVAKFSNPYGCVVNADNTNLFVTDTGHNVIRKIDLTQSPCQVTTVAGSANDAGFVNGTGTAAKFNDPRGITIDANGTLYVADYSNHVIRKITSEGVVTTFAGTGSAGSSDGIGTSASFNGPTGGLTIDSSGTFLYVSEKDGGRIRKINMVTQAVTTLLSGISSPAGITLDPTDNFLYVSLDYKIIRVDIASATSTTIAGGDNPGTSNGTRTDAAFNVLSGLVLSPDGGTIYISDRSNNKLRQIQ